MKSQKVTLVWGVIFSYNYNAHYILIVLQHSYYIVVGMVNIYLKFCVFILRAFNYTRLSIELIK